MLISFDYAIEDYIDVRSWSIESTKAFIYFISDDTKDENVTFGSWSDQSTEAREYNTFDHVKEDVSQFRSCPMFNWTKISVYANENVKNLQYFTHNDNVLKRNTTLNAKTRRVLKAKKGGIQVRSNGIREVDVISGRGGMSNNFKGNQYFRHLINQNRDYYKSKGTKPEKAEVSHSILNEIESLGGRFLIQDVSDTELWHEMEPKSVHRKIRQALSETRKLTLTIQDPMTN